MNSASATVVLKHWGHPPNSGAGHVVLAALIKFGLVADEGTGDKRKARLTDLARKIILDDRSVSPERDAAIREAVLTPPIHKELWEQYKGTLPSDENLGHELRFNRSFTNRGAQELIKEFRKTLAYAQLTASGIISPSVDDKVPPDGELKIMPPETIGQQKDTIAQTNRTVQIPLTGAPWALLQIPFPMSEDNWKELEQYLALMKKPLTTSNK